MISAVKFFIYIQATGQELRCTSRTLQYKTIKRTGITDAADILLQEEIQTVRDSPYESPQVSRKHYANSQLRGQSSVRSVSE